MTKLFVEQPGYIRSVNHDTSISTRIYDKDLSNLFLLLKLQLRFGRKNVNYNKFLIATNCVNLEFRLNAKACLYFALAELIIWQKPRKLCRKSERKKCVTSNTWNLLFASLCLCKHLGSVKDTGAGQRINVLTVNVWINIFTVY